MTIEEILAIFKMLARSQLLIDAQRQEIEELQAKLNETTQVNTDV